MNTPLVDLTDRDIRQREIVPPDKLAACHVIVIGVGAIGRQVAVQLAAVGVASLELIDHDTVGVENLATQAYWPADIGRAKVVATAELCHHINPQMKIITREERFRRSMARELTEPSGSNVMFCCVDSITTRGLIWESVRQQVKLFVDGRMSAEVIRVLASDQPSDDSYYPSTLFAAERAYAGSCTAKSTVYTASIAAGLMVIPPARLWHCRAILEADSGSWLVGPCLARIHPPPRGPASQRGRTGRVQR